MLFGACDLGLPVLAQGGLDPARAAQSIRVGAAGIAVTGILAASKSQVSAAKELRNALDGQNLPTKVLFFITIS